MLAALAPTFTTPTPTWHIGKQPTSDSDDTRVLAPGVVVNWRNRANLNQPPRSLLNGEDWHHAARCFSAGYAIFFDSDDTDGPQLKPTVLARAQAFCRGCGVVRHCLMTALDNGERYGVWAGASGRQRDKMRVRIKTGESIGAVVDEWLDNL